MSLTLSESATDILATLMVEVLERICRTGRCQRERHRFSQYSMIDNYGRTRRIKKGGSLQGHVVEMYYGGKLIYKVEYHRIVVNGLHI